MESRISEFWFGQQEWVIFDKLLLIGVAISTLSCESICAETTSANFLTTEMLLEEAHW